MITKMFEIRDRGTCIVVVASKLQSKVIVESRLLERAGFSENGFPLILLTHLEYFQTNWDPYKWDNRTMIEGHKYIQNHFDELNTGDVVDIEFILGETDENKSTCLSVS